MLARSGKENTLDEETKTTVPKSSLKIKTREFGRELTNTAALKNKRSSKANPVRSLRATKVPKPSSKISKVLEPQVPLETPLTPFLKDIGQGKLSDAEVKSKLKDELLARKKILRSKVSDHDMFRIRDSQEVADYVDEIYADMKKKEVEYAVE